MRSRMIAELADRLSQAQRRRATRSVYRALSELRHAEWLDAPDCPLRSIYARRVRVSRSLRDDAVMKRSTSIGRLGEVADGLDGAAQWSEVTVVGGYVFGSLLDPAAEVDRIELALVVAESPEVVPWMARPPRLEALAELLRLPKLPVSWWWRPADWPVWNHTIGRAVRFWSVDGGRDQRAFDGLASGRLENVEVEAPASSGELAAQLLVERDFARRHLATVTEPFYDRDWRRERRGGEYPESHLWSASAAFLELDDAARRIED
jgi:hypothetical protein